MKLPETLCNYCKIKVINRKHETTPKTDGFPLLDARRSNRSLGLTQTQIEVKEKNVSVYLERKSLPWDISFDFEYFLWPYQ